MFEESAKMIEGKSVYEVCPGCTLYVRLVECTACQGLICTRCAGKHYRKHMEDARLAKAAIKIEGVIH